MNEPPATPDEFNRYKAIRDEIAHEDNLISSRLSWFMASQAFLLSALAIAQGGLHEIPSPRNNYLFPLVPIVALISNVMIFAGVIAGIEALFRWRRMLNGLPPVHPPYPRIARDRRIFAMGWSAPVGLPLVFLAAWFYLLCVGLK